MKATEFLQAAMDVQNARAAEYDQPGGERSMGQTVQAFNAITGRDLTEAEGWLLLQVLKDVRQWKNPARFHQDSALDGVAYSSLKAEALAAAVKHDTPQPVPVMDAPWITHDGLVPNLAVGELIEIKHRDGTFSGPSKASPDGGYWSWASFGGRCTPQDIVQYRRVGP